MMAMIAIHLRTLLVAMAALLVSVAVSAQERVTIRDNDRGGFPEFVMSALRERRVVHAIVTVQHDGYPEPVEVITGPIFSEPMAWRWSNQRKCEILIGEGLLLLRLDRRVSCQRLLAFIVNQDHMKVPEMVFVVPNRTSAAGAKIWSDDACQLQITVPPHGIATMFPQPPLSRVQCRSIMRAVAVGMLR